MNDWGERSAGIEPASSAWKAEIIPLYDDRVTGWGAWIRTMIRAFKGHSPAVERPPTVISITQEGQLDRKMCPNI